MKHPLFTNKRIFAVYSLVWLLLISIQTFAFFQLFAVSWIFALVDGLVFGVLFLIISVGTWYFIRFTNLEKKQTFPFLLEHTTAAFVLVSIWVFSGTLLLAEWFSASSDYVQLIWNAISWRYSSGLLIYVMMVVVYYLYINYAKNQEQIALENKLKQSLQNTEIDLLRSKLNPHFLFNSLNTLSELVYEDAGKADNYIQALSNMYRYIIENEENRLISLAKEISFVQHYFNLQQARDEDKIALKINIPSMEKYQILPVSIQLLVENAIKHNSYSRNSPLSINISYDNDYIVVSNTLQRKNIMEQTTRKGLKNLQERVRLILGNDLIIIEENNLFVVKIPIIHSQP